MKHRLTVVVGVLALGVTAPVYAQPIQVTGVRDDRLLRSSQICAREELLAKITVTEGQPSIKGTDVLKFCADGDVLAIDRNAAALLTAIAICEKPEKVDGATDGELDAFCAGSKAMTGARVAQLAKSIEADARFADFPKMGQELVGGGAGGVGATVNGGAVTTTTDIVARAVATFLEKRAKAEFREFILRRLRNKVCKESTIEGWLPNTCAYLGDAAEDDALPLSLGTGLRTALLQDAAELPDRVVSKLLTAGPIEVLAVRVSFDMALTLIRNPDPRRIGEALVALGDAKKFACTGDECIALQTMLRLTGRVIAVVRAAQLDQVPQNGLEFALKALAKTLEADPDLKGQVRVEIERLRRLYEAAVATESAFKALRAAIDGDDTLAEDPVKAAEARARLIAARTGALLDAVADLFDAAGDLVSNDGVRGELQKVRDEMRVARDIAVSLARADLAKIVTLVISRISSLGAKVPTVKISGKVTRVLSFAIDLATAKDSKEAEAVIEGIAAPVGAWQGKLEDTVLSLSGFVGVSRNWEHTQFGSERITSKSVGPLAAVGLDINLPGKLCDGWFAKWARPGLFLSVIDVGSLLTYADETPTTSTATEMSEVQQTTPLGFAQIFSPGVYLRLGISKTPLVAGFGVSVVPEGRRVTSTPSDATMDPVVDDRPVVRWSGFVAIDVTILPF